MRAAPDGGQDVVGAGGVVAGGLGAAGADEDAAGVAHAVEQAVLGDAQVLGGETVGHVDGVGERTREDRGGIAGDGFARDGGGGESGQLPIDLGGDGGGEALRGGQQNGGGVHVVFGLGQHVGGR